MSARVTTVLWDLDGTLVDSQTDIFDCLCRSVGTAGLSVEKIRGQLRIGPPVDVLVRQAFPEIDGPLLATVVAGFREGYDHSDFPNTVPYPGVDGLLRSLVAQNQFVITNKPRLPSTRMFRKLGWDSLFTDLYTPDRISTARRLTKPELFAQVIRDYSLDARECLSIGDTVSDIQAAHAAGVRAVGVAWGYNASDELVKARAEAVVNSTEELLALLTSSWTRSQTGGKSTLQ
jgi:phosphoglycolate phosphatase